MKLSSKLIEAINSQINAEQWSAQVYLSMALEAADKGFTGTEAWMKHQSEEETEHAHMMIAYLQTRGVKPTLMPIEGVPADFKMPLAMFEQSLKFEMDVTDRIHKIVALAIEEKDYGAEIFFRGFITEQEEEEATVQGIIDRFKVAGDAGVIFVDNALAERK